MTVLFIFELKNRYLEFESMKFLMCLWILIDSAFLLF